jgi:hypothetical protein
MDVLKQLDITYNIFIFVQFTPYEQTFKILLKDTFHPINNRIILLLSLNYFYYYSIFYKICNNSKYLEPQLHNHRIV